MSNKIELLKKIKALADNGIGGEKINAELKLRQMMEELGITEEDLEEDKIDFRMFNISQNATIKKLFNQVISTILDDYSVYGYKGLRSKVAVECTVAEQIEIEAKFEFYKNGYKEDLEVFFLAFLQKNNLFPKTTQESSEKSSEEELRKWRKASVMTDGLDKHHYRKQIEGGNK